MRNIWRDGIYGLAVGDALGVPVEFTSREERKADPVMEMRGYGTHDQPAGTWSDDTSMVLATLDSIDNQRNLDRKDMMKCFSDWCLYGEYTPFREVFDIGNAKADLFKFYCAVNGIGITKVEVHDTFTRFYFEANDIDLMDATNFCEQYIKKQPKRKMEVSRIIVIIM